MRPAAESGPYRSAANHGDGERAAADDEDRGCQLEFGQQHRLQSPFHETESDGGNQIGRDASRGEPGGDPGDVASNQAIPASAGWR